MKKLIGLTGKTGAGKSTVSSYLKDKGAYIIDGDIVARKVLDLDKTLVPKLCKAFGDILNEDGSLNRKALAKKAFKDEENTQKLNSLMHPAINDFIFDKAQEAFLNYDVVVVDAAAIIESGLTEKCNKLIVVTAPKEIRKERIIKRDNISEEDALIRINGQKDDDFYLKKADFVFRNYEPYIFSEEILPIEKELFSD